MQADDTGGRPLVELVGATRGLGRGGLAGMDVAVHAGEVCLLVGPNGAGKSLTVRALAGLVPLPPGQRVVDAERVGRIGLVLAERWCDPVATPRMHLQAVAAPEGAEDRVAAALVAMGLDAFGDEALGTLSTGTQRRLALAAALLVPAQVLLLDEPSDGLDAHWQSWLEGALRDARDRGVGVLVATHDRSLAAALFDRALLVVDGRVRRQVRRGEPDAAATLDLALTRDDATGDVA